MKQSKPRGRPGVIQNIEMPQVLFFPNKFKFRTQKLSFSADPVILDLKLQLAQF